MKKNFIKDTLEKIEDRHIKPKSKWYFLIRKYGKWTIVFGSFLVGVAIFFVISEWISDLDVDLRYLLSKTGFVAMFVPYVLFFIFIVFGLLSIRDTENGYRYSWRNIFIFSLLIFVIVSFVLWLFNVGTKSHLLLESHSSYYKGYVNHMKEQRWNQPQNGFLFGDIVDVSDGNMVIRDGSGKKWTIVFDDETRIGSYVKKIPGEKIKIIGRMTDDGEFNAYDIRPWQGFGMYEKKFR